MKARLEIDGRVARVVLAAPKANVLDRAMIEDLEALFAQLAPRRDLCAIVLASDGAHFSFGASVEEHLPEQIESALPRLSHLLHTVATAPAPTIAAIRGQCLGGGLELVLTC
ncbi:MAG TPA: enoyl-CoA hydratase-related protein, partial [Thermoanaerobaculia bacterium]